MTDRVKTAVAIGVSVIALGIILVGVTSQPQAEETPEDRVAALSASIKCPFCNGESLAESQSSVAADYRALIKDRVAAGATDEEIIAEFTANFGESYILDNATSAWTGVLWLVPIVALVVGVVAVVVMKREANKSVDTDG